MQQETYAFQAEINQLMSLIINTFYSNKEIFLRELISNASDALDKIRYESLTNKECLDNEPVLRIRIASDKKNKTLNIFDTGVGMTKNDLVNNLGTIAKSGTKEFLSKLTTSTDSSDLSLIGQFGVGFYSAFLVADSIDVYSKNNADGYYRWSSNAGGSFTITQLEQTDVPFEFNRGTCLALHLKDEQLEYLEESRIKDVLKKHSQFIGYDIELLVAKQVEKKVEQTETHDKTKETTDPTEDEPKVEEIDESKENEESTTDEKKDTKPEMVTVYEYEVQNKEKPIWLRDPDTISDDEYNSFYKTLSNDWDGPLTKAHFKVEGQLEYRSILFVPKRAPMEMFDSNKKKNNIKLYVKKVFITDDCTELCPEWLSFLKGVVDSDDLPLNVSREMLQQNRILTQIKKHLVKKSLELFEKMTENHEEYKTFYDTYSKNIKLGIHEDSNNRDRLSKLLRYVSLNNVYLSLDEYCSKSKTDKIYYLAGDNLENLKVSPFVEMCKSKGHDVLFMNEPIDEYVMQQMRDYTYKNDDKENKFKFVNLTKEGFSTDDSDEEKQKYKDLEKDYEKLCTEMKNVLGDKVTKVMLSKRLCDTPCVLVTSEYGWSAYMEQIMKSQVMKDNTMAQYMKSKKTLEINPDHKIIKELKKRADNVDKSFKDLTMLMYDSTLLVSGFSLEDPKNFVDRINNMVSLGLGLDDEVSEQQVVSEKVEQTEQQEQSVMENVD